MSEEDPLIAPETSPQDESKRPVPLRSLLTRDVLVASVNYAFLALVDISYRSLQPLFLSTPIAFGGLGLDPPVIGTVMSFYGILTGAFTVLFFSRLTDYFGVKRVYLTGITASVPCFSLFPIMNHLARNSVERTGGLGVEVWVAVALQVALSVLVSMCFGKHISKNLIHLCLNPFQARSSFSSPLPHLIRHLWGPPMESLNYRYLSCAQSVPPSQVHCIHCPSIRTIII